jgi:hypothetical protein
VAGVFRDVDDIPHVAVNVESDPGAQAVDEQAQYLFLRADEIEPLDPRR